MYYEVPISKNVHFGQFRNSARLKQIALLGTIAKATAPQPAPVPKVATAKTASAPSAFSDLLNVGKMASAMLG